MAIYTCTAVLTFRPIFLHLKNKGNVVYIAIIIHFIIITLYKRLVNLNVKHIKMIILKTVWKLELYQLMSHFIPSPPLCLYHFSLPVDETYQVVFKSQKYVNVIHTAILTNNIQINQRLANRQSDTFIKTFNLCWQGIFFITVLFVLYFVSDMCLESIYVHFKSVYSYYCQLCTIRRESATYFISMSRSYFTYVASSGLNYI